MANNCKYYKQKKQVSYDSGQTWSDVSPAEYQVGDLYQIDSPDCLDPGLIRWVVVPGDYICDGKDKYIKEIEQYTNDNGLSWLNVYPATYRKGSLIESNSNVCDNKWEGHYVATEGVSHQCGFGYIYVPGVGCVYVDPVKIVRCSTSSSTTLTSGDTTYNPYTLAYGTIGDCVTEIGDNAFQGYNAMSGVTLIEPDNITSIGEYAFSGCSNLTSFEIPSNVTTIGQYAFAGCSSITQIDIPDSVTSLGNGVFNSCTGLSGCTIGSGITSIGDNSFYYCTGLTNVNIPDSVTSIGGYAFENCGRITRINIPSGVTSIGGSAFKNCSGIASIAIPSGVTRIGVSTFEGCSGLISLNIPTGVTYIDMWAFKNCSGLTQITALSTTPATLNTEVFINTNNCPIYVPASAVDAYKESWSQYKSRIQAIPS